VFWGETGRKESGWDYKGGIKIGKNGRRFWGGYVGERERGFCGGAMRV
jgi:hypothetical protein